RLIDGLVHGVGNVTKGVEDEFIEIFQKRHGRFGNLAEVSKISSAAEAETKNFHVTVEKRNRDERNSQKLARAFHGDQVDARDGTERGLVIEDVGKHAADDAKGFFVTEDGQGGALADVEGANVVK